MEREFADLIEGFLIDFDQRRLDLLDRFLFALLLKKEMTVLKNKKSKRIEKIDGILSRYINYRDIIYARILKQSNLDNSLIIKRVYAPPTRLILLITHSCQLRCKYCKVRKFSLSMEESVLLKGVDLLFSSHRQDLQLQFFGGEPLLRFDLVKKAVDYARQINRKMKRDLKFILTTNGIALSSAKIDFFKRHGFLIECSMDGEIENQLKTRKACDGKNYYPQVVNNFRNLFKSNIPHYSISVVMPENVHLMYDNFRHLAKMGFKKIQMNYALGILWPETKIKTLLQQTRQILTYVKRKKTIEFINLTQIRREPVVLNAELTVDCDGGIYLESGICLEEDFLAMKKKFLVTDVGDAKNLSIYGSTPFQNFYRLSQAYSLKSNRFRKIIINNIILGIRYEAFLRKCLL